MSDSDPSCAQNATRRALPWSNAGILLIGLLPLAGQVLSLAPSMAWTRPGSSDYAGLELDVRTALRGDLLLGAVSRLGGRNLGPVHAYWTAPWYVLTGQGVGGMVVASWMLQFVAIVVVALIVRNVAGPRAMWFALVALAIGWLRAGPHAMSDFYNPVVTMPTVIVATVAGASVALGRWRWLPVLALAASFGSQLHLSAAPGLIVIAGVAVVLGLFAARPRSEALILTAVIVAVAWMPTLVDEVAGTRNISALLSTVARGADSADQPHGRPTKSAPRGDRAALAVELSTLTVPNAAAYGTLPGLSGPYLGFTALPGPTPARTVLGGALMLIAVGAAWRHRRTATFGATIIGLGLGGAVITFLLTASQQRGFVSYYLAELPGYAIAVAIGLAMVVERRVPGPLPTPRATAVSGLVVGGLTTFAVTVGAASQASPVDVTPATAQLRFAEHIERAMSPGCPNVVDLDGSVDQVADIWTLMVALDRAGIPVTVAPKFEDLVDHRHRRSGHETVAVELPSLEQLQQGTIPADAVKRLGCDGADSA